MTPLVVGALAMSLAGCLKPPDVGKAAAPEQARSSGVMGGGTNKQVNAKVDMLVGLLDGKLTPLDIKERLEKEFAGLSDEERKERTQLLEQAMSNLPPGIGKGRPMPQGTERDMVMARLYFSERRFIEAADFVTRVLDSKPDYPEARNLLARSFFFLGNPDRTIKELELRQGQLKASKQKQPWTERESYEYLDSLFLIGAAVAESPGTTEANLRKGQFAWTEYLEMAPTSPSRERVVQGLQEIEAGLRGEGRLAHGPAVRAAAASASPQNVMGGSRSFAGGGPAGPAKKKPERVKKLPPDASEFDRAKAQGLDALDMREPGTAQGALQKAAQLNPADAEVQVGLARVLVQTGSIPEALQLFGEIIRRTPKFMPAWHYNGMAHMMSGDAGQAVKSWEHIKSVDEAYFNSANLAPRVKVAKRMAAGR